MDAAQIADRLNRIEELLSDLLKQRTRKEWYSTAEVADLAQRAEFTVREWCRLGRITAEKESNGRQREWRISHDELQRILNHGPRPLIPRH